MAGFLFLNLSRVNIILSSLRTAFVFHDSLAIGKVDRDFIIDFSHFVFLLG